VSLISNPTKALPSVACTVIDMFTGKPPWTQHDNQMGVWVHMGVRPFSSVTVALPGGSEVTSAV